MLTGTPTMPTTTATTHTYTVTDSTPVTALTAALTFMIMVNEAETTFGIGSKGAAVHVYPNPAGDVLHIEFPGADEYGIALLTLTGQPVLGERHAGGGFQILDLSSLTKGVYFLKIEDSEGGIAHLPYHPLTGSTVKVSVPRCLKKGGMSGIEPLPEAAEVSQIPWIRRWMAGKRSTFAPILKLCHF